MTTILLHPLSALIGGICGLLGEAIDHQLIKLCFGVRSAQPFLRSLSRATYNAQGEEEQAEHCHGHSNFQNDFL